MRKLSWACDQAQLHHGLCVVAITEGGASKRNVIEEGFTRYPELKLGTDTLYTGSYHLVLAKSDSTVGVSTRAGDCTVRWSFSYPQWKLISFAVLKCECPGSKLANHQL